MGATPAAVPVASSRPPFPLARPTPHPWSGRRLPRSARAGRRAPRTVRHATAPSPHRRPTMPPLSADPGTARPASRHTARRARLHRRGRGLPTSPTTVRRPLRSPAATWVARRRARRPASPPHARMPGTVVRASAVSSRHPVADRGTACVRPFQPRYAVHRRAPRSTPSSGRAPGVATAAASSPGTLRRRRPPPAVPCPDDHGSAVPALACRRRRVWSGPVAPGARVRNAAAPCPEIRSVRAPDVHGDAKSPRVRPRKAGGNDPPPARPPPRVVHPGPTTAKTSRTVTAGRCDDHTRTLPATGSFGLTGAHPLAMGETWGEPCQDRIRRPLPAGVRVRRRRHPDCLTVSDHHSDLDRRSATWRSGPASRNHWCRWYSAALPT